MNIAIVIPCYNRTASLQRLLDSLQEAYYGEDKVDLIFSIDFSGTHDVERLARAFEWRVGEKKLVLHSTNIGLKRNILSCGDFTENYDAVIVLEDDLYVAKDFYNYAKQAALYYESNDRIGGVSLFGYAFAEIGYYTFYPFKDEKDNYFMQWPSSWGQLWTRNQWKGFRKWLALDKDITMINIPTSVKEWTFSWKKFYVAYLVDTDKYFVYPYVSFTNEFGTAGIHYMGRSNTNTVNLFMGKDVAYNFRDFSPQSMFNYDVFFELHDCQLSIGGVSYKVCFDTYANKEANNLTAEYVFTSRVQPKAIKTFGHSHIPFEYNLLKNVDGDFFYLVRKEYFVETGFELEKKVTMRMQLSGREMLKLVSKKVENKFIKMILGKKLLRNRG